MQERSEKFKQGKFDNISITAFRIISILNMLLKNPCDDKQINRELTQNIEGARELSKDTICIYLNTLRSLGCEITRPTKNNGYKYILKSYPFKLFLTKNEIDTLIEARKYISVLGEWKTALKIDRVFNNLLNYFHPDTKNFFLSARKFTLKREINTKSFFHEIKQLENYCKHNKLITLVYNSPKSGGENITIRSEKITLENGAFYLWGYSQELETTMYLRIDRILDIKSVSVCRENIKSIALKVRYKLAEACPLSCSLPENESIIEKNSDGLIIEADVANKFKFFQKILSYGDKCTILYPPEIKDEIVAKLKKMYMLYDDNAYV